MSKKKNYLHKSHLYLKSKKYKIQSLLKTKWLMKIAHSLSILSMPSQQTLNPMTTKTKLTTTNHPAWVVIYILLSKFLTDMTWEIGLDNNSGWKLKIRENRKGSWGSKKCMYETYIFNIIWFIHANFQLAFRKEPNGI